MAIPSTEPAERLSIGVPHLALGRQFSTGPISISNVVRNDIYERAVHSGADFYGADRRDRNAASKASSRKDLIFRLPRKGPNRSVGRTSPPGGHCWGFDQVGGLFDELLCSSHILKLPFGGRFSFRLSRWLRLWRGRRRGTGLVTGCIRNRVKIFGANQLSCQREHPAYCSKVNRKG